MKKVTYKGKLYTVEQIKLRNDEIVYQLSGGEWVNKKDTTHWLSCAFNKHFNSRIVAIVINMLIIAFVIFQILRFNGLIVIEP